MDVKVAVGSKSQYWRPEWFERMYLGTTVDISYYSEENELVMPQEKKEYQNKRRERLSTMITARCGSFLLSVSHTDHDNCFLHSWLTTIVSYG